jgi:hypothetical protein
MNTKKLPILLAVLALIFSTLACAGSEPGLSNARTAKDDTGATVVTTFAPSDTIFAVVDLNSGKKGDVIGYKWYSVDVADNDLGLGNNTLMDEIESNIDEDSDYTLHSYFEAPDSGWPTGSYKVEIYYNGVLTATVAYSVQ